MNMANKIYHIIFFFNKQSENHIRKADEHATPFLDETTRRTNHHYFPDDKGVKHRYSGNSCFDSALVVHRGCCLRHSSSLDSDPWNDAADTRFDYDYLLVHQCCVV